MATIPVQLHGIKDNHHRGRVADFLSARISHGSRLPVVSAYFAIYTYEAPRQMPARSRFTCWPRDCPKAFRRVGSTDQRCVDDDLWVLRGASQPQVGPDMVPIADARMTDFDAQAIAEYRRLRALANPESVTSTAPQQGELHLEGGEQTVDGGKQTVEGGKRSAEGGKRDLSPLPPELALRLPAPGQRLSETALRQLIRDLCGWHPLRGEELATLLSKDLKYLRNRHLSAMVQNGELAFQYPESPNHQRQAYKLPTKA